MWQNPTQFATLPLFTQERKNIRDGNMYKKCFWFTKINTNKSPFAPIYPVPHTTAQVDVVLVPCVVVEATVDVDVTALVDVTGP